MVATRRNNPGVLAEAISLSVGGELKQFSTEDAVFNYLRKLELRTSSLHIQAAQAKFMLGQAIIEAAKKLGYGQKNHLYNRCGINIRRAQLAIKFAEKLADEDGSFSIEKFKMWERKALDLREKGKIRCRIDREGTPSPTAIEKVMGGRPMGDARCAPRCASGTTSGGFVPIGQSGILKSASGSASPDNVVRGAGGSQLTIDFDLSRTQAALTQRVERAVAALRDRLISKEDAARINAALEDAGAVTDDILEHARG